MNVYDYYELIALKNAILAKTNKDSSNKDYYRLYLRMSRKYIKCIAMKIFLCLLKNNIKISREEANKLISWVERGRKILRERYGSLYEEHLAF